MRQVQSVALRARFLMILLVQEARLLLIAIVCSLDENGSTRDRVRRRSTRV